MKYTKAITFVRQGDLMQYLKGNHNIPVNQATIQRYSKIRDIQLVLWVRYSEGKTYCKINCPINPLPIKGEFEVVSENLICKFLLSYGWTMVNKIPLVTMEK